MLGGRAVTLHYRIAGEGPPLFLLHPSPFSSAFMAPLMQRLRGRATLIAPDTPGFGESDAIVDGDAGGTPGLKPYVDAMIALRRALGLERVAVYGSATGAQIAIEWAKADAESVCGLVLDNAASFTDAERATIMDGYFPDLTPAAAGSHLARAWQAAHDATLFFPWQRPASAHRIAERLGSAAAMDFGARAYLAAGPGYEVAYRAAFGNERAERVQPIEAPLVVLRWQGSILKPWMDRFDDLDWGDNVVMAHCGPEVEERWSCLEANLDRVLPAETTAAGQLCLDTGAIRYADADFGQIRYRVGDTERPVGIVLHGPGGSSDLADDAMGRGWIPVDLPGHGGSAEPRELSVDHCVQAVTRVMERLGLKQLQVAGIGVSERLARQVAARHRGVECTSSSEPWIAGALPDLEAETSGAHLWRGWYWLRAQYLERGENPPPPARLTRMLLALLDSRSAYCALEPALDASGSAGG